MEKDRKIRVFVRRSYWVWTIILLFLMQNSYAQVRDIPRGGSPSLSSGRDTTFSGKQGEDSNTVDTFGVFYVKSQYPESGLIYLDTVLNKHSHQYDLTRLGEVDLMHLGNYGSATHPLLYEPESSHGFNVGLNAFRPYWKEGKDLPFYIVKKAFTELGFTLGSEQSDESVYAKFGKSFTNGLSLSLDYNRISQLGRLAQYNRQNTRNTGLVTGVRYQSKNKRYDAFFSFTGNTIEQEDNGGVYVEPIPEDHGNGATFSLSSGAILLTDAKTRHQHRVWGYTHYYKLRREKKDSVKTQVKRVYKIAHDFLYSRNKYRFSSDKVATDTLFGQWFPGFEIDERGHRVYIKDFSVSNQFRIITHATPTKGNRPTAYEGDYLSVGITHKIHNLYMEPVDTVINNLFLNGEWVLPLKDRLQLRAKADLGLWDNAGDYFLSGILKVNLKKAGIVEAGITSQLAAPSWIQSQFRVTQKIIWKNDFKKSLKNSIHGSYALPKYNFKVQGTYRLMHNHLYSDTLGLPQQEGSPISILSLVLTKDFRIGKFHLNNSLAWQTSSSAVVPVPEWVGKHSFYFRSRFRKMLFQLGVDVRYLENFKAYYYNPLTGTFQLQNRQTIDFYPNLDAWFSFKISSFRFFIKYENITRALGRDSFYYTTAFYPFPDTGMRLGIRWKMVN